MLDRPAHPIQTQSNPLLRGTKQLVNYQEYSHFWFGLCLISYAGGFRLWKLCVVRLCVTRQIDECDVKMVSQTGEHVSDWGGIGICEHAMVESNATAQPAIFERLTYRLKGAGAQPVAVMSIAGHLRQPGKQAGARRGRQTTDGPNVSLAPFRCPRVGVPSGTHALATRSL